MQKIFQKKINFDTHLLFYCLVLPEFNFFECSCLIYHLSVSSNIESLILIYMHTDACLH